METVGWLVVAVIALTVLDFLNFLRQENLERKLKAQDSRLKILEEMIP